MKAVTYYECDFCGTHSKHAPYIKGHEKRCWMNPVLQACRGCRWWFKNRPEYGSDYRHTDHKEDFLPFCSHPVNPEYSITGSGYFENIVDEPKSGCEGWEPINPADMEERKRLKTQNRKRSEEEWKQIQSEGL